MKKLPRPFLEQPSLEPGEDGRDRVDEIAARIGLIRGTWVILDEHLAEIFDISVSQLTEPFVAHEPVPGEFRFPTESRLSAKGKVREAQYALTEHGALVAALLLDRPDSAVLSLQVVRAFIRRRQACACLTAN